MSDQELIEILYCELKTYTKKRLHVSNQIYRPCKICCSDARIFDKLDFNKVCGSIDSYYKKPLGIEVFYRKCKKCGFIFTDFFDDFTPDNWRTYVYNQDYYERIDPDYGIYRPKTNSKQLECILRSPNAGYLGLDYGGGNGLMSNLLCQKGYQYDCYDPYGVSTLKMENIGKYNFCSLFEVAEHSIDPISLVSDVLRFCNSSKLIVLIGTQVHDGNITNDRLSEWWYAAPRNGHVSLYSKNSLHELAIRYSLNYISISHGTHIMYREYSKYDVLHMFYIGKFLSKVNCIFCR